MKSVFYIGLMMSSLMLASGCAPLANCLDHGRCSGDDDDDDDDKKADAATAADGSQTGPMCVTGGKPHIGLGGEDIAAKDDGPPGGDRARVKPFTALKTEYARVLGTSPSSVDSAGSTFGIPQDRWFLEPIASGVYVNKAFEVAFEGCSDMISGDSKFEVTPSKDNAHDVCNDWARRFWSRDATPEQLDACVAAATDGGDAVYLQQQNYSLAALAKRDAQADPFGTAPAPATAPADAPQPANDHTELQAAKAMIALQKGLANVRR